MTGQEDFISNFPRGGRERSSFVCPARVNLPHFDVLMSSPKCLCLSSSSFYFLLSSNFVCEGRRRRRLIVTIDGVSFLRYISFCLWEKRGPTKLICHVLSFLRKYLDLHNKKIFTSFREELSSAVCCFSKSFIIDNGIITGFWGSL